jgi:N-acetylglucosamine transport system permease protein
MKRGERNRFIISFLAPAVILYAVFVIWPLAQAFWLSLFRWRGLSPNKTFVGLQNYGELSGDSVFWRAVSHNVWLLVACGLALIILGLAIAHAMQGAGRAAKALRAVYLFPQVISMVVVAILWMFLLNPSYGLVTSGLKAIGLETLARPWLGDPGTALPAVGFAFIWCALGFYIMLFAAGLEGIPSEITEAANLDGSAGIHKFWNVSWPMLWSVRRVAFVYIVINVMNIFALVFLMTQGGPDRHTEVSLTYLYEQAFKNNEFGYATAVAASSFVVAMALSLSVLFVTRKDPQEARA